MSKYKPTASELEILQVLWEDGPSTVKEVHKKINYKKQTGYTTTLKIMQIMTEKGFLERKENGRSHIYSAIIQENETQKVLLDRFLDTTFGGSASKLIMQALGNYKTSRDELEEIKNYLNQLEGGIQNESDK